MTRSARILDFYASKSWAILEPSLQEMFEIYKAALERKIEGVEFDPQAVAAKLGRPLDNARAVTVREGIAILPVSGPIFRYANLFTEISGATSIEVLATDFRQALDDRAVQAIVLEINSPGGEVDGTSELAQHIFEARGKKPITAYVSHLGASAAMWIASACDEIVCADTASLGSIGVVGAARISKDKSLIEFVSSQSPNKRPNPETESGRAQIQKHIDDLAQVFIETVARNRDMSADDVVSKGASGGLLVGQLAVDAGLADRVGTLEGVLAELQNSTGSDTNTRAENLNPKPVVNIRNGKIEVLNVPLSDIGADNMADQTDEKNKETKPVADGQPPKTEAKVDTAALEAAARENAELKRQLAEAKEQNTSLAKETESVKGRVADLEKQARTSRFTELSKGWPGETKDNLAMLEHLATSKGEDSDLFKAHVKSMNAAREQVEASGLLKELGSSAPVEGTASAEIDAKARKMADESAGKLTYQQAYDQVYSSDTALRARLTDEERRASN